MLQSQLCSHIIRFLYAFWFISLFKKHRGRFSLMSFEELCWSLQFVTCCLKVQGLDNFWTPALPKPWELRWFICSLPVHGASLFILIFADDNSIVSQYFIFLVLLPSLSLRAVLQFRGPALSRSKGDCSMQRGTPTEGAQLACQLHKFEDEGANVKLLLRRHDP